MTANAKNAPTHLRRIAIKNFRGIDDLELSFLDPYGDATSPIVIGGPNGSGKTRVLEAILLVLHRFDLIPWKDQRREGLESAVIVADIQKGERQQQLSITGELILDGLGWSNAAVGITHTDFAATYFSSWRAPRLIGAVPIELEPVRAAKVTDGDRVSIVKKFLVNALAHARMAYVPEGWPQDAKETSSVYFTAIRRLNEAWAQFRPGATELFSAEPVSADPGAGFDVFLRNDKGLRVPLDALSSGELEVFTFLGWMVIQPLELDMIFIDEPELHLDSNWHALALRAYQRVLPDTQFIVATHSHQLYESVYHFQRNLLVPTGDPRARDWHSTISPEDVPVQTGAGGYE